MINVSVAMKGNPRDLEAPKKAYGTLQTNGTMTLEEFATHISEHGSVFKRAEIISILTASVDCLREMMLEGKRVNLGLLGDFYPTIESAGAATVKDYVPKTHIKRVNVRWAPGKEFRTITDDAEYKVVLTRREAKIVISAKSEGKELEEALSN